MDNIKDENLKRLGRYIAQALIDQALMTEHDDWIETNIKDNAIGELARCVTLNNLYLDREEYEKCAIMKLRIKELTDRLNIKDENLKRLGKYIAEALIDQALMTERDDWIETNIKDHAIGELARCMTLQNLYLDREEYEKCAIMKLRIQDLTESLNIQEDFNPNIEEDDET